MLGKVLQAGGSASRGIVTSSNLTPQIPDADCIAAPIENGMPSKHAGNGEEQRRSAMKRNRDSPSPFTERMHIRLTNTKAVRALNPLQDFMEGLVWETRGEREGERRCLGGATKILIKTAG